MVLQYMMDKDDKFVYGAIIFIAAIFVWFMFFKKRSSSFTSQSFDGMTAAQATASFTQQTAQIVQEMKQKLTDAIAAGNTKEQLIAISDEYSQYSCDLSKAYQRFQINNMPTPGSPAPAPVMAPGSPAPAMKSPAPVAPGPGPAVRAPGTAK